MKRQLTEEQKRKSAERKEKFKVLWKQVAAMPEAERVAMSIKLGFVTCDGHALSGCNSMLIAMQCPTASVLGGFRQWLKHGRCVRKGEHGLMIWVPTGGRKNDVPLDGGTSGDSVSAVVDGQPSGDSETRFLIGTIFDIGQTDAIEAEQPVAVVSPEIASAFGMASLPNVRVQEMETV